MHTTLTRALIGQTLSGRQAVQRVMPRRSETSIVIPDLITGSKKTKEQQGVWSLLGTRYLEMKDEL